MDLTMNVFQADAFSMISLTDSINKIPFVPGRIGELGIFSETGITTTGVEIEEQKGLLTLISPTSRGGPGETRPKNNRTLRTLNTSHFQIDDMIKADEVQNIREFGQPTQARSVESYMGLRFSQITPNFDATLEHQRLGAIKGIITDKTGATVYNLYSEFGVTAPTPQSFSGLTSSVKPRALSAAVVRAMAKQLGGTSMTGVYALCDDAFWDALILHPDVEKTMLYQEGAQLRNGIAYQTVTFGGITWENYKGYVPNPNGDGTFVPFLAAGTCQFFPLGVPNLFRTVFAPADYMETVNTVGLPRYAKVIAQDNNKGARLEMQTNPLSYCSRPGALLQGTLA